MDRRLFQAARRRGAVVSSFLFGTAFLLGVGARPVHAQAAHLVSNLTSTRTSQIIQLTTDVFPLGNGRFRWQYTLTNPFGNSARIRFLTVAPHCDLSQIANLQSPPGWTVVAYRNQSDAPDAPKINWFVGTGQPGPFAPGTPWLIPGGSARIFSFDLPFGANNQLGLAGALDTYGFSGITLGCQIGNLTITSGCPAPNEGNLFRVGFHVQFQNQGNVTITITRGGASLTQTLTGLTTGDYSVNFNLGAIPGQSETILINGTGVENGVSFTASATSHIMAPIVIAPGVTSNDPADSDLTSGSPTGLVNFLSGNIAQSSFVCPPLILVAPFCPPNDPIDEATDMLAMTIQQAITKTGFLKIHLIGHGGGAILARWYLSHPQNVNSVRSLTLVSPPNKGSLRAIISPNRNEFTRYWPAYPFWSQFPNGSLYITPQNFILSQDLGFNAPPVPTVVIYGTGIDTPAIGYGSSMQPYSYANASGDGTVIEASATALAGATLIPIPGLHFTNGLSNSAVEHAILPFILAH